MVALQEDGAGNPGGTGSSKGSNGTGGLLIVYSRNIINKFFISSNGLSGGASASGGGSSGGGSVNIFYKDKISTLNETATGGSRVGTSYRGGAGGNGTVTIGNISTGTFVKDE